MAKLLIIFFILTLQCFGAQMGVVKTDRAVIYSDLAMQSPIGYIRKGKKIAVGEVKRKRGKLLPVAIHGKVGWVKVSDVLLPGELKEFEKARLITEHAVLEKNNEVLDPLGENNFFTVRGGLGKSTVQTHSDVQGESTSDLSESAAISFMFQHKNPYHSWHWGLGFDYFEGNLSPYQFRLFNLKGGLAYVPLRLSWTSLEAYGNLVVGARLSLESSAVGTYRGNLYGVDYGVLMRFLPEYKIGLVGGVGFTYYRLLGFDNVENTTDSELLSFKTMTSSNVFAGLSYRF